MAELNFGLLTPQGSQSIGNAFVTGMDQAQEARARDLQMQQSVRQGQMAELQFKKAQDTEARLNQWYAKIAKNGGPTTAIEIENQMIQSDIPQVVDMGLKARMTRLGVEEARRRYAEANAPAPAAGAGPMPPAVVPEPGSFGADVMGRREANPFAPRTNMPDGAPTEVNNLGAPPQVRPQIDALNARINANLALGTEQGNKTAEMLQKQADNLSRRYTVGTTLMGPEGNVFGTAPEKPPAPPSMVAEYTFAKTPDGGGFRGSFQDFVNERAAAARPPAQPRPEQPAQPVIDPDNPGKIILVSREEAIRRRMTPANTVEKPMTEAQRIKYAKDKVSDKNVVTGALAVTGELEKLTDELVGNPDKKIAPAPGLNSITGYSALTNLLALPSGDARKALQKLETFKGKIMALGRQLASQEGKLGNMAVQEWKFVSDAVQKIDPAAGNLDAQMRDVVRQSKEYALRQQSKYDDTYADDLTAPPAGAGKPSLDSIFGKKNP